MFSVGMRWLGRRFAPWTAEGGCLHMGCGAACEQRVPFGCAQGRLSPACGALRNDKVLRQRQDRNESLGVSASSTWKDADRSVLATRAWGFGAVPSGLGSTSTELTQDLRPGLSYAAPPGLEFGALGQGCLARSGEYRCRSCTRRKNGGRLASLRVSLLQDGPTPWFTVFSTLAWLLCDQLPCRRLASTHRWH